MKIIHSTRFGDMECPEDRMLKIPSGIIGFPASTRYLILDHDRDVPFQVAAIAGSTLNWPSSSWIPPASNPIIVSLLHRRNRRIGSGG